MTKKALLTFSNKSVRIDPDFFNPLPFFTPFAKMYPILSKTHDRETYMGRPRKFTEKQLQRAADDRRAGMSWQKLSQKYKCAINTIRTALAEYSNEFLPDPAPIPSHFESQLQGAITDITKIKKALQERFNLHI